MAHLGEVEIDWWPAARIGELQAFIDAEWKRGHVLATDEELLRWQHPRDDDRLSVVAATAGGELVGILGVIPADLCVRGTRTSGGWLTTWTVVPAFRKHRVGLGLLEFVLARHDFVGTLGGNATTMAILRALRFHTRAAVPRWVRPLAPDALRRLVSDAPAVAAAATPESELVVRDWAPDVAEQWDRTWAETIAPSLVGTWRDSRYLSWRYEQHPSFRYRVRVAEEDGAVRALLVHRVETVRDSDVEVVRIVEALGDADGVAALAAELVREAGDAGVAFADFYCTGSRFAAPLERAGFVAETSLGTPFPARFQPLQEGPAPLTAALRLESSLEGDLFEAEDVYFTRSDCDQDRPS